jgi:hypothetical protein
MSERQDSTGSEAQGRIEDGQDYHPHYLNPITSTASRNLSSREETQRNNARHRLL